MLDFATGTGTFLLEVIRQIFRKFPNHTEQQLLIRDHVLKNLYGFEYLIAPYTIAHVKLSQFLKDAGYELREHERLQIFLTNTLEPTDRQISIPMLPALTEETKQAQKVKDQPILVILGNPPYSYESKNTGAWIREKIKAYYLVDGKKLEEKNPKGLQDDYVKFIRFAQDKMDQVAEGIVAIITNHSFLDNPTFRGMRHSLMQTFHQMYFIDLHGNAKKKEKTPDGGKDENVFDIEQGVAISILVKKAGLEKRVYHADFWGTRENKYRLCLEQNLQMVDKRELHPCSPAYFFMWYDESAKDEYEKGVTMTDIFSVNSMGIATARDHFTIEFSREDAWKTIQEFVKISDEEAREKFQLGEDVEDWTVACAKEDLLKSAVNPANIISVAYRPFDMRYTYYTGKSRGFHCRPRFEIMQHLLKTPNYALAAVRRNRNMVYTYFVTQTITDKSIVSSLDNATIFPLYLYEKSEGLFAESSEPIQTENLTKEFRQLLERKYHTHYTPEQIFGAIYGLLYSPAYRKKYAEFLKIDFPRFIFPETNEQFEQLSTLGWQLVHVHLLQTIPAYPLGEYHGEGDHHVLAPEYRKTEDAERLYINKTQYFDGVPEAVYRFQIGGYQVLDKYLKDRKGRALTLTDVKTIRNTIKALAFTIEQMQKIDAVTREWI